MARHATGRSCSEVCVRVGVHVFQCPPPSLYEFLSRILTVPLSPSPPLHTTSVKEAESQLTDEADKLATELEEKSAKLVMVEAERTKLEEYMRGEVTGAMQMTSALRGELERRLDELTSARKEADESKSEMEANNAKMNEMKKIMERQESTFKWIYACALQSSGFKEESCSIFPKFSLITLELPSLPEKPLPLY